MATFEGDNSGNILPPLLGVPFALGNDWLYGYGGDDLLAGYAGDDTLEGGTGSDVLIGGSLDIVGGLGTTSLAGTDTASYVFSSAGVGVDLSNTTDVVSLSLLGIDLQLLNAAEGQGGDAAGDLLVGITNLTGSDYADVLTGNIEGNTLIGSGGSDNIRGLGGSDTLLGGEDVDRLDGGAGNDHLFGGSHRDKLIGGLGDDLLDGGSGQDQAIYHSLGASVVINLEHGTASGGGGEDVLLSIEDVFGSAFDDVIYGSNESSNVLQGSFGNDSIYGLAGDDDLYGDDGDDVVKGGDGGDNVYGGLGQDVLHGNDGRDFIVGGSGNDIAHGGNDVDYLYGGTGDDMLYGGGGTDFLYGGSGADKFVFTQASDTGVGQYFRDEIRDFSSSEGDVIDLTLLSEGNIKFAGSTFTGRADEFILNSYERIDARFSIASLDFDGDAKVDAQIYIETDLVSASDFIL